MVTINLHLTTPCKEHMRCVLNWARKWEKADQIGEDVFMFACLNNAKSGNITGLIKSHKEGYPLRVVTTGCGTVTENLSAFTEYYLSPLSRENPVYIQDTTHLPTKLQKIIFKQRGRPWDQKILVLMKT